MSDISFQLVEKNEEIDRILNQLSGSAHIALDTEFLRTNTYFAQPGLVQVGYPGSDTNPSNNYLIDPLSVSNLDRFANIFGNPDVTKIMHSMSEDVELLYRATGAELHNVFDTQIAAAFLGYGCSLGYQKLVSEVLDIELDKSETRSDWLARPLTASQMSYAALDVEYLLELYSVLNKELQEKGFSLAAQEEAQRIVSQSYKTWQQPELAYLKLRGGCELNREGQMLLKEMVEWRDKLAIEKDIPKPWVFSDASLIAIAEKMPKSASDLKRIKGMQFKSLRRYGEALLDLILEFKACDNEGFQYIDKPVRGRELEYYQRLKSVVAKTSEESGIEKQLLGSRKMLESLVIRMKRHQDAELPEEYSGWRKEYLGEKIIDALELC